MILWAAGSSGPHAIPGQYSVRFTVDTLPPRTLPFRILNDPTFPDVTAEDLEAQLALATNVRDATSAANRAVISIRDVNRQVDERVAAKPAALKAAADTLSAKLRAVEAELYQVKNRSSQDPLNYPIRLNNRMAALLGIVEGVPGRPTKQSYEVYNLLKGEIDAQLAQLRQIYDTDLAAFNRLLQAQGLQPIRVATDDVM
jgi:hypothetical protein